MTNNVVNVLFDCQEFDGLEKLQSAALESIVNKHFVHEYLDIVGFIPNISIDYGDNKHYSRKFIIFVKLCCIYSMGSRSIWLI